MTKDDFRPSRIGHSSAGRPVYQGTEYYGLLDEQYSERTTTVPYGDKWVAFPSVDRQGNMLSEDQMMEYLTKNGPVDPITGEVFPTFGSIDAADASARNRSHNMQIYPDAQQSIPRNSLTPETLGQSMQDTTLGRLMQQLFGEK